MENVNKVVVERQTGGFIGEKLKRGVLIGKREGTFTPSPRWKYGLIQPDGSLTSDFNFSSKASTLSARKLAANLWEIQHEIHVTMSKNDHPILGNRNGKDLLRNELKEMSVENHLQQPARNVRWGQHVAATSPTQHNARVKEVEQAEQPPSSASYCSSMEMPPHRPAISARSLASIGKSGESSGLKTSTELLKVLNRIWRLEEKHAIDMSLVKLLRRELDEARVQIQDLLLEKKRNKLETDNIVKQTTESNIVGRKKRDPIKDTVKLMEVKAEDELKSRRNSEKVQCKLAKELSEMKSLFSNALRELERERKARTLLEDLCDEFARGIRDYEQLVWSMKNKFCKDQNQFQRENIDKVILHISEAWLDERTQMKLAGTSDDSVKESALDKLCFEIEGFLQAKQFSNSSKDDHKSAKTPNDSKCIKHPSESFHFNEHASAPWKRNDEDDSVNICGNRLPTAPRTVSAKQVNNFVGKQGELTLSSADKDKGKFKMSKKKLQSQQVSGSYSSLTQLEDQRNEGDSQPVNEGSSKLGIETLCERRDEGIAKCGAINQISLHKEKNIMLDADVDLQDTVIGSLPLISDDNKVGCNTNYNEEAFDPSAFTCPSSPVKKWSFDVSAADPYITEASSQCSKRIKRNTLKAKLMEARLEGEQSRARTP